MLKTKLVSPWIEGIDRHRPVKQLEGNVAADVAVVGAGIAGISTAYFLLRRTKKRVLMIEANRVAHGATGHNAGQLVSYFERPFHDIVHEFGLELAAAGQQAVESAWDLLEEMRNDLALETPFLVFQGYAGCADEAEMLSHLKDNAQRKAAGLECEEMLVADDVDRIPRAYHGLYRRVSRAHIAEYLETKEGRYIAMLTGKKGVMNSARFSEEVATKLLAKYPDRFTLVEQTPVQSVALAQRKARLITPHGTVTAKRVILCTNGFEKLHIYNEHGADLDVKFHHLVRGIVGYMSAFTEEPFAEPAAISYLPSGKGKSASAFDSDPYFYFTRRPHAGKPEGSNLVCIAGPEVPMDDTSGYSHAHPYPEEAKKMLAAFMKNTYRHVGRTLRFQYFWHGLMGYTPNGIRCVGAEPCNPVLMYNLGCNGVGILPSLYGSYRISQIVRGEKLEKSIFDPQDQRCYVPVAQRLPKHAIASDKWFGKHSVLAFVSFWVLVVAAVLGSFTWRYFTL